MGIYKAVFFLVVFSLVLLAQYSSSTSDKSAISGDGLVQSTRIGAAGEGGAGEGGGGGGGGAGEGGAGEGGGEGGGTSGGTGDGDGESSSSTQPSGIPLGGAGTATTPDSQHHKGAAMNSPSYNFSLLTVAIFLSLCASLHIWI